MMLPPADDRNQLRATLREATGALTSAGVHFGDVRLPGEPTVASMRRRRLRAADDEEAMFLALVRDDRGVLSWETDAGPSPYARGRRAGRFRGAAAVQGEVVEQFKYRPLEGSKVAAFLHTLDTTFNAHRGIRALTAAGLGPTGVTPNAKGKILLLVHGTFSKADVLHKALASFPEGQKFLVRALRNYDQVLAFEHPTLAVSPMLNALVLARSFHGSAAQLDVICHSRGGLVVRWWLEALNTNPRLQPRVVFVGSPLQGTSLASPDRLRRALDLLTNVVFAVRAAGDVAGLAVPMLGVIGGLARLVGSATHLAASTPVVDAAIAMIPGLTAQALMPNNFELESLASGIQVAPATYAAIQSNFEPVSPGWRFWQYFMRPGQRAADFAADQVFPKENDLVVDTASMTRLSPALSIVDPSCVKDFGTNDTVHHLNYFEQKETVAFCEDRFS